MNKAKMVVDTLRYGAVIWHDTGYIFKQEPIHEIEAVRLIRIAKENSRAEKFTIGGILKHRPFNRHCGKPMVDVYAFYHPRVPGFRPVGKVYSVCRICGECDLRRRLPPESAYPEDAFTDNAGSAGIGDVTFT